jgi:KipI family sensor histidine kinase inhibitor
MPGFAYLGGLDPRLKLDRRAMPRAQVPQGSIAIAGLQTAVYPSATPGGWHLIGRCPSRLFDPARSPASLIGDGDTVVFEPVDRERFETLWAQR